MLTFMIGDGETPFSGLTEWLGKTIAPPKTLGNPGGAMFQPNKGQ
jgi:hypothetical protein